MAWASTPRAFSSSMTRSAMASKSFGPAMAEVLGPVLDANIALDPCDVPAPGLLAQHGVLILDRFGDDAAAGYVVLVHQDEPSGDLEVAVQVERDGRLRADRQLGDFVPA